MSSQLIVYHFAFLRVVPHVHLGAFTNVGVILHARTTEFLGLRRLTDSVLVQELARCLDTEMLARYLHRFDEICAGDAAGGPVALLPPSERFHWLTAPRSDVLQTSPVHEGLCESPEEAIESIFASIASNSQT